jgi:2,3-bisphosphoglycerate-independent phosphoglycerate mutase
LDEVDLIFVHVEAPDEAGHLGNAVEKVKAIEQIDRHILGPLLGKLGTFARWRILVAPDHPTPVEKRIHTATPPPFCMAGTGINHGGRHRFTETDAVASGIRIEHGHQILAQLLSD